MTKQQYLVLGATAALAAFPIFSLSRSGPAHLQTASVLPSPTVTAANNEVSPDLANMSEDEQAEAVVFPSPQPFESVKFLTVDGIPHSALDVALVTEEICQANLAALAEGRFPKGAAVFDGDSWKILGVDYYNGSFEGIRLRIAPPFPTPISAPDENDASLTSFPGSPLGWTEDDAKPQGRVETVLVDDRRGFYLLLPGSRSETRSLREAWASGRLKNKAIDLDEAAALPIDRTNDVIYLYPTRGMEIADYSSPAELVGTLPDSSDTTSTFRLGSWPTELLKLVPIASANAGDYTADFKMIVDAIEGSRVVGRMLDGENTPTEVDAVVTYLDLAALAPVRINKGLIFEASTPVQVVTRSPESITLIHRTSTK